MKNSRWNVFAPMLLILVSMLFTASCVSRGAYEELQTVLTNAQSELADAEADKTLLKSDLAEALSQIQYSTSCTRAGFGQRHRSTLYPH